MSNHLGVTGIVTDDEDDIDARPELAPLVERGGRDTAPLQRVELYPGRASTDGTDLGPPCQIPFRWSKRNTFSQQTGQAALGRQFTG